jgi:signal transduction histidine kinase
MPSVLIEKVIFYALGCVLGVAVGFIILSLDINFKGQNPVSLIIIISGLSGMLAASVIHEITHDKTVRNHNKLRDESTILITHEMRTSLTSTSWAIELILQNYSDKINDEDKKILNEVNDSIHVTIMHSINLLDISLVNVGKLSASFQVCGLDIIENTFKEIAQKYIFGANKKGVELFSEIKLNHKLKTEVDMVRLRIVLENLLENALQYTNPPNDQIFIKIDNDPQNINIMIRDTGIGIPVDERDQIFTQFYRASNARKKLSSGSGIGLHMCRQYVKNHNGTIRFESKENEGTAFFVTIPIRTATDTNEFLNKI